ncbi:hypothetical protein DLAC_11744 [Tieghemostelium lacteum]|uniref:Uncharacterized protein n=1 Tax=Tieghemostelium lacteum TaxID=361077 RepID=A0A151Z857_TIELA|nr:hypothetical protein DLAC_11744 [Tieghemostelium lacteum]|eukprot:KYQ90153.1 hypothetical protein DLAC_11744 [Tieghemostelium lacteum]
MTPPTKKLEIVIDKESIRNINLQNRALSSTIDIKIRYVDFPKNVRLQFRVGSESKFSKSALMLDKSLTLNNFTCVSVDFNINIECDSMIWILLVYDGYVITESCCISLVENNVILHTKHEKNKILKDSNNAFIYDSEDINKKIKIAKYSIEILNIDKSIIYLNIASYIRSKFLMDKVKLELKLGKGSMISDSIHIYESCILCDDYKIEKFLKFSMDLENFNTIWILVYMDSILECYEYLWVSTNSDNLVIFESEEERHNRLFSLDSSIDNYFA